MQRASIIRLVTPLALCALGLTAASCGEALPNTTSSPAAPAAGGAPKVAQFASSPRFWCLPAYRGQAQTTIGWSVPAATDAVVLLDGRQLHLGLRKALPFAVLAGQPSGIGATVVFPCRSGDRHRMTIRWSKGGSAAAERTVTIRKARHA